jgi:PKHD-type hydroxylase
MNVFPVMPCPSFGAGEAQVKTWSGAFSYEELDHIVSLGQQLMPQKATIGGYQTDQDYSHIRSSLTSWIPVAEHTQWIYNRMASVLRTLNGEHFRFDLWGFAEQMQFTEYQAAQTGHYDWHLDAGAEHNYPPRKLSLVLQLSDPDQYEGGDLQVLKGHAPESVFRERGLIAAFPSFLLHRVTPVTSGVRHSLVSWVCGPAFR